MPLALSDAVNKWWNRVHSYDTRYNRKISHPRDRGALNKAFYQAVVDELLAPLFFAFWNLSLLSHPWFLLQTKARNITGNANERLFAQLVVCVRKCMFKCRREISVSAGESRYRRECIILHSWHQRTFSSKPNVSSALHWQGPTGNLPTAPNSAW